MSIITDWTPAKGAALTKANLSFQHDLHNRPMFGDAGLESLLDRYPRERLEVFTMGEDPVDWRTWRKGSPGNLTGSALLEAAQTGRIWLNLRRTNHYLDDYAELSREVFAEKAAHSPGLRTSHHDLGMLISSANAQVFYHLDVSLVSLWQLRGQKTVWVYPVEDPYVGATDLERIVLRETAEQMAFDLQWDRGAEQHVLTPGKMVTWKQNAPHRIENGPMLNVSLSIEFMTPQALMRANMIYGNGVLRRSLGLTPKVQNTLGPAMLGKVAVARGAKALNLYPPNLRNLPTSFHLDPVRPGQLLPA